MQKLPFQFGLKAVFATITGAAALLAIWVAAPELAAFLALLIVGAAVLAFPQPFPSVRCWAASRSSGSQFV